jgi:hypothetical protein
VSVFLTSEDGQWSVNLLTLEAVHIRENILADTNLSVERWELVAEPNGVVIATRNDLPESAGMWLREIMAYSIGEDGEGHQKYDFGGL